MTTTRHELSHERSALVLGAYGLIGAAVARDLAAAGWRVVGLGRSRQAGLMRFPPERWITADIAEMTTPDAWAGALAGVDAVVNCAGALQDGGRDDLEAVHATAIEALVGASEAADVARIVQISAPGARQGASTAFLRSKARGDSAIQHSRLDWVILRPGVVIGAQAYGGSALLRMLAAQPAVLMLVCADARLMTVSLDDVADAARRAAEGDLPVGSELALVEEHGRSLEQTVLAFRRWLGLPPPWRVLRLPLWAGRALARIGDGLIRLGWRSTISSTALTALGEGVDADPEPFRRLAGGPLAPLERTLAAIPAGASARRLAWLALLKPLVIGVLALFWLLTGIIVLSDLPAARAVLAPAALPDGAAQALVLGGAALDIALGLGALIRRVARPAFIGMILTSAAYLVAATALAPALWLDPMGALVKAVPIAVLSLVALALLEER